MIDVTGLRSGREWLRKEERRKKKKWSLTRSWKIIHTFSCTFETLKRTFMLSNVVLLF